MAGRWLDVQQAARELGLSTDAVRKRIARGSLASEERDGRRVVWLDSGGTTTGHGATPESGELVEELRSRVRSLERQLEEANTRDRENRRLLAAALERVPELPESPKQGEVSAERAPAASSDSPIPDPSIRKLLRAHSVALSGVGGSGAGKRGFRVCYPGAVRQKMRDESDAADSAAWIWPEYVYRRFACSGAAEHVSGRGVGRGYAPGVAGSRSRVSGAAFRHPIHRGYQTLK